MINTEYCNQFSLWVVLMKLLDRLIARVLNIIIHLAHTHMGLNAQIIFLICCKNVAFVLTV